MNSTDQAVEGRLIIPAMFFKGWSPTKCSVAFESQAAVAFQSRPPAKFPFVWLFGTMLIALFNDALYCAKHLEQLLQETYSSEKKMLDSFYAIEIGAKIGLPIATVSKPSTLLFTNYNGIKDAGARLGKDSKPRKALSVLT